MAAAAQSPQGRTVAPNSGMGLGLPPPSDPAIAPRGEAITAGPWNPARSCAGRRKPPAPAMSHTPEQSRQRRRPCGMEDDFHVTVQSNPLVTDAAPAEPEMEHAIPRPL